MLASRIELILLVTGVATSSALLVFVAPAAMLKMIFGQAPTDALGLLIARHWGLLIGLVGVLLVYAAYHAEVRAPTMVVAIVEKTVVVLGIFSSPFRRRPSAVAMAAADAMMATIYFVYLIGL